jgi:hypothetical protein
MSEPVSKSSGSRATWSVRFVTPDCVGSFGGSTPEPLVRRATEDIPSRDMLGGERAPGGMNGRGYRARQRARLVD